MKGHRCPESKRIGRAIVAAGGKFHKKAKHGPMYQLANGTIVMVNGRMDDPRAIHHVRGLLRKYGISI